MKGKKYLKHAIKNDPYNITANLKLAKLLTSKLLNINGAINCYKRILQGDP